MEGCGGCGVRSGWGAWRLRGKPPPARLGICSLDVEQGHSCGEGCVAQLSQHQAQQQISAESTGQKGTHQHVGVKENAHVVSGDSRKYVLVGEPAGQLAKGQSLAAQVLKAHQLQLLI